MSLLDIPNGSDLLELKMLRIKIVERAVYNEMTRLEFENEVNVYLSKGWKREEFQVVRIGTHSSVAYVQVLSKEHEKNVANQMREAAAEIIAGGPEACKAFLFRTGMYNKDGSLKDEFK